MGQTRLKAPAYQQPSRDKQLVEALRERLNRQLQNDPVMAKKAALILESWLKKKN